MDRTLLVRYLKFLFESADALLRKEHIEDFEIAALRRDLHDFKSRLQADPVSNSKAMDAIYALDLKVSESDVGGGRLEPLKFLMTIVFFHRFLALTESNRQSKAKKHIEDFRNDVRGALFVAEHAKA